MAPPSIPDVLAIPAVPPPQGLSSNLINPYSTNSHLIVTYSVCLTVVILSVAIRTFTKAYVLREMRVEDC